MESTRAIQLNKGFQLETTTLAIPPRQSDELLVKILSVGLNPVDYKFKNGAIPINLPCVLGHECVGEVVDADDERLKGRKIMAYLPGPHTQSSGALTNLIVVPKNFVAFVPDDAPLDYAAYPLCGLTAQRCFGRISQGKVRNVFVAGVTGGVGWLFVQFCRQSGMDVYTHVRTAASREKIEAYFGRDVHCLQSVDVPSLEAIQQAFGRKRFDACADFVGGQSKALCMELCDFHAQFVTIVEEGSSDMKIDLLDARNSPAFQKSLTVHFEFLGAQAYFGAKEDHQCYARELEELAKLVQSKTLHYPNIKSIEQLNTTSVESGLQQLESRSDPSVNKIIVLCNFD